MAKNGISACLARDCARCVRAIRLQNYMYQRLKQTDLRSEFRRSATIRSTTFTTHYFRTEVTPRALPSPNPPQKGNLLASLGG